MIFHHAKENIETIIKELNSKVARFTGCRPQKCPWGFNEQDPRCLVVKEHLTQKIENAINRGYTTFLCGMAIGFDMICAEIVIYLKTKYPQIKLFGALPCNNQDSKWNADYQKRYRNLLKQLDGIRQIYDTYEEGCMQERNNFMINNSSLVIALFDGKPGGTAATLSYAKQQGLEIEIIKP